MRAIIDASTEAIISVDDVGHVVVFNIAAETMFRFPAAKALGQTIDLFIPARSRAIHRDHLRNFAEHGVSVREMGQYVRLSALRSDGSEFPIEASISRTRAGGKNLFTVSLRDITGRREAEAAVASL